MIAVVTGSTGFIGSQLTDALRARGAEVRVLRRPVSRAAAVGAGIATHIVDLRDAASVERCDAWDGATHCFHLGGATKGRSEAEFAEHNVLPTRNIAAAIAARGAGGPHLVYVSSQAAAGPASGPNSARNEDQPPIPVEAYGASKLAAETAILSCGPALRSTIVRPAAVYGPGDRDFLQAFRQACGRIAVYAAPADQQFSVVHVRDVVAALIAAATSQSAPGRTYFVGNVEPTTWRQLYRGIARLAGTRPFEVQIPGALLAAAAFVSDLWPFHAAAPLLTSHKVALSRPRWWLCDSTRARTELGWAPTLTLDAGLRDTFDWYRAAGWLGAASRNLAVAA